MKITTEVNLKKKIRYHIVKGAIDVHELSEYLKDLYNSLDSGPDMNACWDLQEADFTSVSSEDVRVIMKYVNQHWGKEGKNKAALVVSRDLGYGMSRMFQAMMDGKSSNEINIFKDINEAKKWIEAD